MENLSANVVPTDIFNKGITRSILMCDGFELACTVANNNGQWCYPKLNPKFLGIEGQPHSYVYAICVDEEIVKIGETGNPIMLAYRSYRPGGPIRIRTGSKSRLGRYMNGCSTDECIRESLREEVAQGKVTIIVKECEIKKTTETILGKTVEIGASVHKELELYYLDTYQEHYGNYPLLNVCRK